jgi:hypothetical protein
MSLVKNGLVIDCEQCVCRSEDGRGGFGIDVPIIDRATGVAGIARIRCVVSSEGHTVELASWAPGEKQPPEDVVSTIRARADQTLDYVAQKRICGNRDICPSEVVRIVEAHSRS